MGGFGSGRREYATTPTVGECHTLDVTDLSDPIDEFANRADTAENVEAFFPYRWRDDHGHGETVATIGLYVEREGPPRFEPTVDGVTRADRADALAARPTHVRLEYTTTPESEDRDEHEYRVDLEYTPCNFGGVRPWFRCPGRRCGERVGKLYRPPSRKVFACRECYDLGYLSSRRSGDDVRQAILRYKRAFAKADAKDRRPHPNSTPYLPERPSGMHHATYSDLADDVQAARREFHDVIQGRLRDLAERSSVVDADELEV